MEKYLKRIGIALIAVAVVNLIVEIAAHHYFLGTESQWFFYMQNIPGIIVKNLLCLAAGVFTLSVRKSYTLRFRVAGAICFMVFVLVLLTTAGTMGQKVDALINPTSIPLGTLLYTLFMMKKEEEQWEKVSKKTPSALDLRLKTNDDWFNPVQVGPSIAINSEYVRVLERFISSMRSVSPLEINMLCGEYVSDAMQSTIRESVRIYYEEEENRVRRTMETRYRRIIVTFFVSVLLIVIWKFMGIVFEKVVYWEIIGNLAAFGLWQSGYTHYDQKDMLEELLRIKIGKEAEMRFIHPDTHFK